MAAPRGGRQRGRGRFERWAIVHELGDEPEPPLGDVLAKLSPVDLVIVEGFKRYAHPKLEVYRAAVGKPLLHPDDDPIVAIATDAPLKEAGGVMLDDVESIANILQAEAAPRKSLALRVEVPREKV